MIITDPNRDVLDELRLLERGIVIGRIYDWRLVSDAHLDILTVARRHGGRRGMLRIAIRQFDVKRLDRGWLC